LERISTTIVGATAYWQNRRVLFLGPVYIVLEFILYRYFEKAYLLYAYRFSSLNPWQKVENRLKRASNKTKEDHLNLRKTLEDFLYRILILKVHITFFV